MNRSIFQTLLISKQTHINESPSDFVLDKWLNYPLEKVQIVVLYEHIELMANFLIINFKFFSLRVRLPLRYPCWQFDSFDLSELKYVRQANCAPNTVSAYLTFFSFLKWVHLPGHRPASVLILLCESPVSQIFLFLVQLLLKVKWLAYSRLIGDKIEIHFIITVRNWKLDNILVSSI